MIVLRLLLDAMKDEQSLSFFFANSIKRVENILFIYSLTEAFVLVLRKWDIDKYRENENKFSTSFECVEEKFDLPEDTHTRIRIYIYIYMHASITEYTSVDLISYEHKKINVSFNTFIIFHIFKTINAISLKQLMMINSSYICTGYSYITQSMR